jgi:hypothetical protein
VDDYVVMAAEHDLVGPLLDLATAVALGGELSRPGFANRLGRPSQAAGLSPHNGAHVAFHLDLRITLKAASANPEPAETV